MPKLTTGNQGESLSGPFNDRYGDSLKPDLNAPKETSTAADAHIGARLGTPIVRQVKRSAKRSE